MDKVAFFRKIFLIRRILYKYKKNLLSNKLSSVVKYFLKFEYIFEKKERPVIKKIGTYEKESLLEPYIF